MLTDFFHRIDDRKSANPRMRGFLHGSKIIFQERGIKGFFQGFVPTTARQAANSATRFGSYTTLRQFAQGYVAPGEKLGTVSTFAIGGMAGFITVYVLTVVDFVLILSPYANMVNLIDMSHNRLTRLKRGTISPGRP